MASSTITNNSDTISLPLINQQFILFFPDMVLGKHIEFDEYSKQEIPREMIVEFLPENCKWILLLRLI